MPRAELAGGDCRFSGARPLAAHWTWPSHQNLPAGRPESSGCSWQEAQNPHGLTPRPSLLLHPSASQGLEVGLGWRTYFPPGLDTHVPCCRRGPTWGHRAGGGQTARCGDLHVVGNAPWEAQGRGSGWNRLQVGSHAGDQRYLPWEGRLKGSGGENQGSEGPPSLPWWGGEGRQRDDTYHAMETQKVGWEAAYPQETPSSIQDTPSSIQGHHPWALLWAVHSPWACPGELSGGSPQKAKEDTGHSPGLMTAAGGWSRRPRKVSSSHCFFFPPFSGRMLPPSDQTYILQHTIPAHTTDTRAFTIPEPPAWWTSCHTCQGVLLRNILPSQLGTPAQGSNQQSKRGIAPDGCGQRLRKDKLAGDLRSRSGQRVAGY